MAATFALQTAFLSTPTPAFAATRSPVAGSPDNPGVAALREFREKYASLIERIGGFRQHAERCLKGSFDAVEALRVAGIPGVNRAAGDASQVPVLEAACRRWRDDLQSVFYDIFDAEVAIPRGEGQQPMLIHPLLPNLEAFGRGILKLAEFKTMVQPGYDFRRFAADFGFRVELERVKQYSMFQHMAAMAQSINDPESDDEQDPYTLVRLNEGSDSTRSPVFRMQLKPWLGTSLFEKYITTMPSAETALTFSQYTTINLVYDNMLRLMAYHPTETVDALPDLPPEIVQRFPVLRSRRADKLFEWNSQRKLQWAVEINGKVEELYKALKDADIEFLTPKGAADFLTLKQPNELWIEQDPEVLEEKAAIDGSLTGPIGKSMFAALAAMDMVDVNRETLRPQIIALIVEAQAAVLRTVYLSAMNVQPSVLEEKARLIENLKRDFRQKVSQAYDRVLAPIVAQMELLDAPTYERRVSEGFYRELVNKSRELHALVDNPNSEVKPNVLVQALSPDLIRAGVQTTSLGQFGMMLSPQIGEMAGYDEARQGYRVLLQTRLAGFTVPEGTTMQSLFEGSNFSAAKLRDVISRSRWSPQSVQGLVQSRNPIIRRATGEFEARQNQDGGDRRQRELLDFVTIGEAMGYFRPPPTEGKTKLGDLGLDQTVIVRYRNILQDQIRSQYPILGLTTTGDHAEYAQVTQAQAASTPLSLPMGDPYSNMAEAWREGRRQRQERERPYYQFLSESGATDLNWQMYQAHLSRQLRQNRQNMAFMNSQFGGSRVASWIADLPAQFMAGELTQLTIAETRASRESRFFQRLLVDSTALAGLLRDNPILGPQYTEILRTELRGNVAHTLFTNLNSVVGVMFLVVLGWQLTRFAMRFISSRTGLWGWMQAVENGIFGKRFDQIMLWSLIPMAAYIGVEGYDLARESQRIQVMEDMIQGRAQGESLFSETTVEAARNELGWFRPAMWWVGAVTIPALALFFVPLALAQFKWGVGVIQRVMAWRNERRFRTLQQETGRLVRTFGLDPTKLHPATFHPQSLRARTEALYNDLILARGDSMTPGSSALRNASFHDQRELMLGLERNLLSAMKWISDQERHWAYHGERLRQQFYNLGLEHPTWNFGRIRRALEHMKKLKEDGKINDNQMFLAQRSHDLIMRQMGPYLEASLRDPVIRAVYFRVWGLHDQAQIAQLDNLAQFGPFDGFDFERIAELNPGIRAEIIKKGNYRNEAGEEGPVEIITFRRTANTHVEENPAVQDEINRILELQAARARRYNRVGLREPVVHDISASDIRSEPMGGRELIDEILRDLAMANEEWVAKLKEVREYYARMDAAAGQGGGQ